MTSRERQAAEIQREIGEVLLRRWDPIGVAARPEADAEYDAYVSGVYRLLASGAPAREIADHPANVEATQLGFQDTDPKMLIPVAEKLLRLNVRLAG